MKRIGEDIDEIRNQRNLLQDLHSLSPDNWPPPQTAFERFMQFALKYNALIFLGAAVVVTSVLVVWLIELGQKPAQSISDFRIRTEYQNPDSSTPVAHVTGDIAHDLETLPLPAAGIPRGEAGVEPMPRQSYVAETSDSQEINIISSTPATASVSLPKQSKAMPSLSKSATLDTDNVEGGQLSAREDSHTAASADNEGKWIINLASLSKKVNADRFIEMAQSKDIETKQQQVTVEGKQYWRVRIVGFSTFGEAKDYAVIAKEKLGLKDVWITTH